MNFLNYSLMVFLFLISIRFFFESFFLLWIVNVFMIVKSQKYIRNISARYIFSPFFPLLCISNAWKEIIWRRNKSSKFLSWYWLLGSFAQLLTTFVELLNMADNQRWGCGCYSGTFLFGEIIEKFVFFYRKFRILTMLQWISIYL